MGIRPGHRLAKSLAPRPGPPRSYRSSPFSHSRIDFSPPCHPPACRRSMSSWLPQKPENGWFLESDTKKTVSLVQNRLKQDPYGRIRLIRAVTESTIAKVIIRNFLFGYRLGRLGRPRIETHCIPFWTVTYMMCALEHIVDPTSGRTVAVRENIDDHGFSVAAVPDDHWCSGIVLKDDARDLHDLFEAVSPKEKDAHKWFQLQSNPGGLDPLALAYDLRNHLFDEDRMPPFAKGYPQVPEAEQYKVVSKSRQLSGDNKDKKHVAHFKTLRPAEIYAVPTYRIAYKLIYPDGQIGYWDGAFNPFKYKDKGAEGKESLFAFTLNDGIPKINLHFPDSGDREYCTPAFVRYMDRNTLVDPDDALIQPIPGVRDLETMLEHATLFAQATARTPLNWQDPNILPADVQGKNDLRSLVKHAFARLLRIHPSVPPKYQAAMPEVSDASRANTTTSGPRLASMPLLKRRLPKSQAVPKSPNSASQQQAGSTSRSTTAPPPRTAPRWHPPPPRPAPLKPTAPPVVVKDPAGYYARLEIEPHPMFLDASTDAPSLAILSGAKRTMQMVYHPDRAKDGNVAKFHRISQEINIAYDYLDTLAKRKAYQDA